MLFGPPEGVGGSVRWILERDAVDGVRLAGDEDLEAARRGGGGGTLEKGVQAVGWGVAAADDNAGAVDGLSSCEGPVEVGVVP